MNRWEMEKKIAIHAMKDPAFKRKLLLSPKEAVREFLHLKASLERIQIRVYEEKKNEWVFSIPYMEQHTGEISEKELEKLFAAGSQVVTAATICGNSP